MASLKKATTSKGKASHYYLEEVIGRTVEIKFENEVDETTETNDGGDGQPSFYYKGQITDIQITYKKKQKKKEKNKGKENDEKEKKRQRSNNNKIIKYVHHFVEFDDGDSGWINLMKMKENDGLRWPKNTNTNTNTNNPKQQHPQLESKRSCGTKINNNMKEQGPPVDGSLFDDDVEGDDDVVDVVGSEKDNENENENKDETEDFSSSEFEFEDEDHDKDIILEDDDDDYNENGKNQNRNNNNNKKKKKKPKKKIKRKEGPDDDGSLLFDEGGNDDVVVGSEDEDENENEEDDNDDAVDKAETEDIISSDEEFEFEDVVSEDDDDEYENGGKKQNRNNNNNNKKKTKPKKKIKRRRRRRATTTTISELEDQSSSMEVEFEDEDDEDDLLEDDGKKQRKNNNKKKKPKKKIKRRRRRSTNTISELEDQSSMEFEFEDEHDEDVSEDEDDEEFEFEDEHDENVSEDEDDEEFEFEDEHDEDDVSEDDDDDDYEDGDDEDVSEDDDDDYDNGKKKQRNNKKKKKPKKTKRRRKATTISELEDHFEIGTRVTVFWPSLDEWYKGTVISEMDDDGRLLIEYDDGETNWLDVIADKWRRSTKPDKFIKNDSIDTTTLIKLKAEKIAKLKVGSRISVWWPGEKEWYTGTLSELKKEVNTNDDNNKLHGQPHRISYDDGDEEWTNLIHRKFKRVQAKAERLVVGYRVSVFNYEQKRNYRATVTKIDLKRARPHKVKYDDANKGKEWLNLNVNPFLDIDYQRKKGPNVAVSATTLKKRKREFLGPTPNEEKRRPPRKVIKRGEDDAVVVASKKRCEVPCAMCKSRAKRPRALSCHHILCKQCIEQQPLDLESCPLCQVPISSTLVKYDPEHASYKAVEALSKTTAEVAMTFSSASSASVDKKRFVPLRIIEACQSKRRDDREHKGYYWRFKGSKDRILRVGEAIKEGIAVEQVDSKTGEIIEVFSSSRKAADITKVSRCSIRRVLDRRGKANAGGFFWRFEGETHGPWPDPEPTNLNPVEQLDFETGDFLCSYTSIAEAKRAMGMRPNAACIREVCDGKGRATAQGYFWRWKGSKAMPNHLMGVSKICQIRKTRNGRVIKEFRTSRDAQAFLGDQCCWSTVCRYCREKGFYMGYYWEYRQLTKKKSAEEEVIGRRLRVKQQGINDEWLEGKITAFDSDAATHTILFDSGTTRRHKLEDIIYEFKNDQGQKPVEQLDLKTGNVLATFSSISDASKCVGKKCSLVLAVCAGRSGSSAGYFWRYKGSDALPPKPKCKRKLEQLCLETGRVISTFDSISAAGRAVGISTPGISYCCNGRNGSKSAGGFGWRFSKEEESTTS